MDDDSTPSVDAVLDELKRSRAETAETIELLRASRERIGAQSARLESPQAVFEYIDFFTDFFANAAADLDRIITQLPAGASRAHVDTLRQLASNSSAQQRRCLMFRDKWINKPLPYEDMRSALNQISVDSRDQLTAFRSLTAAADRLERLAAPAPKPAETDGKLDRRALFTRWFEK
jgi:hypothetical protein